MSAPRRRPGTEVDILVVGQGLAGTFLAHALRARGLSLVVVDDGDQSAASRVSAGLFNPIMPRKLKPSWGAEEQIPFLEFCVRSMQVELSAPQMLHRMGLLHVFSDGEERNRWINLGADAGNEVAEAAALFGVRAPFGAGVVPSAGYIEVEALLARYRMLLAEEGALISAQVSHGDLEIEEDGCYWSPGGVAAKHIVFCEGHGVGNNPWFSWIPIVPVKGEILTARADPNPELERLGDRIVSNQYYVIPLGGDLFRLGSTWHQETAVPGPTEEARERILAASKELLPADFTILDHRAGVRPRIRDGRPVAGRHPDLPRVWVLNGLGSRGVMFAPLWADRLAESIANSERCPHVENRWPEVAPARFRRARE